ncbi:MAG TPA: ABC transporter permease [Burkholderiaceae bacterium]|nr:ABC transporter permease [Burkholderiaceae bacterium]
MSALPDRATLRWWLWLAAGQWRAAPGRAAVSVLAVAIGVALALAIHLVNASALEEFRQAIATVNGEAHAQVRARGGDGFDEEAWAAIGGARIPGVAAASPVLELELALAPKAGAARDDAAPRTLRLVAIDPFAAAAVTPALMPQPAGGGAGTDSPLFDPDAVFLSAAALESLGAAPGDALALRVGLSTVTLRIAGTVPGAAAGQRLAVMDLGAAQWRFGRVGRLTRIDLRLADGADAAAVERAVVARLPAGAAWSTPDASEQRMSNVSRAYRVNLNVLALVALFTGAFLVFATMALSVVRQQGELALLGVLGASPAARLGAVLAQGAALGATGAALGTAAGIGLAAALLAAVGGDLGGGYFSGSRPPLALEPLALAGFAALGLAVGLLGAALPAWAAARMPAARALRGGSAEDALAGLASGRTALALGALGAALLPMPPLGGLPIPSYLAIACWLLGGVAATPLLVRATGAALAALAGRALWRVPAAWLATTRLAQSPGTVAAGLAGVVASFALASAMAIMVTSFRISVADWLDAVLPADVYARAPDTGAAAIDEALQRRVLEAPGIARAEFLRSIDLVVDPARPPVALIVRRLEPAAAPRQLPLAGPTATPAPGTIPVWVSEPMLDRYRLAVGGPLALPIAALAGAAPAGPDAPRLVVAGVWRDYARQHGALAIDVDDWTRLGGSASASDVALWLEPGTTPEAAIAAIAAREPALAALEWRSATELRALSLRIFDRSFAVTYALEAIAILVGLFGVAAACAGEALARAREFGMLRHVGVRRGQIAAQLAIEATLGVAVAVAWGGAVGAAIGLVLIERVNPQSFHWTMQVHWPVGLLAASAAALLAAAVAAALLAGRGALGAGPLAAVREDW